VSRAVSEGGFAWVPAARIANALSDPAIPQLEVGSRYVAGAAGAEVGGDWFSVIDLGDGRFGFVVGDVSGRGVDAAAIMARIRFTLRAYLLEGHTPADALSRCSRQIDISVDGHFATALVGVGDLGSGSPGSLVVSNAGHLNPIIFTDGGAHVVAVAGGVPLGVAPATYESTTLTLEPGATLLAFTDGLVERRDEDLDDGLRRLLHALPREPLELDELLSRLLNVMTVDASGDDIAILAFRRLAGDRASAASGGSGNSGACTQDH